MKYLGSFVLKILCLIFMAGSVHARSLSTTDFSFLRQQDPLLQKALPDFLNQSSQWEEILKYKRVETLVERIYALYPDPSYSQTLKSLHFHFKDQPESIEFLARNLHNTWLARWGQYYIQGMSQDRIDRAHVAGMMGLVMTLAGSWKSPQKALSWERYVRLTRDLFVPVAAAMAVGEGLKTSNLQPGVYPEPPLLYFDFPVSAEQQNEEMEQAYQEMLAQVVSFSTTTGLVRFLRATESASSIAFRGSSFAGRVWKPVLLFAALSYGIEAGAASALRGLRLEELKAEWMEKKLKMEMELKKSPETAGPSIENFVQSTRKISFFLFLPVVAAHQNSEYEISEYGNYVAESRREQDKHLSRLIEILQARLHGARAFYDPLYLEASEADQRAIDFLHEQAQQEFMELDPRPENNEEAFQQILKNQIVDLEKQKDNIVPHMQEKFENAQAHIYEELKASLRAELMETTYGRCHREYEKYEFSQSLVHKTQYPKERVQQLLYVSSLQPEFRRLEIYHENPKSIASLSDMDRILLEQAKQWEASDLPPMTSAEGSQEIENLKEKWSTEFRSGQLCSHSPLFLTQVYEYLKDLNHPLTRKASHNLLELLIAQKALIHSIL